MKFFKKWFPHFPRFYWKTKFPFFGAYPRKHGIRWQRIPGIIDLDKRGRVWKMVLPDETEELRDELRAESNRQTDKTR